MNEQDKSKREPHFNDSHLMEPDLERKTYLSDGAYVGWTSWGDMILFTTDGETVQNRISLDACGYAALMQAVDRRNKIHTAMAERQAEPDDRPQDTNPQPIEDNEDGDPFLKGIMERD